MQQFRFSATTRLQIALQMVHDKIWEKSLLCCVFLTIGSGTTTRTERPRWRRSASTRPSRGGSESEAEYEEICKEMYEMYCVYVFPFSSYLKYKINMRISGWAKKDWTALCVIWGPLDRAWIINVLVKRGGIKFRRIFVCFEKRGFDPDLTWLDINYKKVTHSSICRTYCTFF